MTERETTYLYAVDRAYSLLRRYGLSDGSRGSIDKGMATMQRLANSHVNRVLGGDDEWLEHMKKHARDDPVFESALFQIAAHESTSPETRTLVLATLQHPTTRGSSPGSGNSPKRKAIDQHFGERIYAVINELTQDSMIKRAEILRTRNEISDPISVCDAVNDALKKWGYDSKYNGVVGVHTRIHKQINQ